MDSADEPSPPTANQLVINLHGEIRGLRHQVERLETQLQNTQIVRDYLLELVTTYRRWLRQFTTILLPAVQARVQDPQVAQDAKELLELMKDSHAI